MELKLNIHIMYQEILRETEGLEDGLESEGMKVRKTNPNNMQHGISFWMNEWLVCFSFDAHQPIRFL